MERIFTFETGNELAFERTRSWLQESQKVQASPNQDRDLKNREKDLEQ